MSTVRQLYELQEKELELEVTEQAIYQATSQLGENQALINARNKLIVERQRLDELRKTQHSLEWETEDLAARIKKAEDDLYGGRIRNPKELSSLQQETEILKAKRVQLDNRLLEIMEQIEEATGSVVTAESALKAVESEWQEQQQKLTADVERLRTVLAELTNNCQQLSAGIEPEVSAVYRELRKQKKTAVARVEQGICRGCRISQPASILRQARSGSLVRCGSCGRILYLA
ncbi:MAG: hypothetical protein HYX84_03450 [Chloroflexi bacterium]|nr:hypothetical protein [Chloroflexota bacterium]